jgi:hypothetical protein
MSQTDDSAAVTPTNHPRVFYRSPAFDRGELEVAKKIADSLGDEWEVHITIGPYRGYNIQFKTDFESRIVHLDFYSVRPCGEYDVNEVTRDIKLGIQHAS